nr:hypothetical protein [Chitinophagales bacterium]
MNVISKAGLLAFLLGTLVACSKSDLSEMLSATDPTTLDSGISGGTDDPAGDDSGTGGGTDDPSGDDHGSGGGGADDPSGDDSGDDDGD